MGTYQITNLPTSNSSVNGIMLIVRLPSIHFVSTAAAKCASPKYLHRFVLWKFERLRLELLMIGRTCSSRSHEQNTEDKRQKYGVNSLCCINADAFPHLRAAIAHNIVVSTKQKGHRHLLRFQSVSPEPSVINARPLAVLYAIVHYADESNMRTTHGKMVL